MRLNCRIPTTVQRQLQSALISMTCLVNSRQNNCGIRKKQCIGHNSCQARFCYWAIFQFTVTVSLEKLTTYRYRTHDVILYRNRAHRSLRAMEIQLKPDRYPTLPSRRFVMPCRPVCGLDLRRVHFTCLHCRIRRIHSGKIPPLNELEDTHTILVPRDDLLWPYTIYIFKNQKLAAIKRVLLKQFIRTAVAQVRNGRLLKRILTGCEFIAN